MWHENRVNFLLPNFLFVITFSHVAGAQAFNSTKSENKPYIISEISTYKKSIEHDSFKQMVSLKAFVDELVIDWKYASKENFTGVVLYKNPIAFVRLTAAESLQKVQQELAKKGLGLKLFRCLQALYCNRKNVEDASQQPLCS